MNRTEEWAWRNKSLPTHLISMVSPALLVCIRHHVGATRKRVASEGDFVPFHNVLLPLGLPARCNSSLLMDAWLWFAIFWLAHSRKDVTLWVPSHSRLWRGVALIFTASVRCAWVIDFRPCPRCVVVVWRWRARATILGMMTVKMVTHVGRNQKGQGLCPSPYLWGRCNKPLLSSLDSHLLTGCASCLGHSRVQSRYFLRPFYCKDKEKKKSCKWCKNDNIRRLIASSVEEANLAGDQRVNSVIKRKCLLEVASHIISNYFNCC